MATILVVDDESGIREFVTDVLVAEGHEVVQAADGAEALHHLEERPFDLIMLDLTMPGDLGGLDVLRRARAQWPETQALVLTAHGTVQKAVEAMRLGAYDFLEKPIAGPADLRRLVERALNWRGRTRQSYAGAPVDASLSSPSAVAEANAQGPPEGSRLQAFLWELKRRRVYTVTVAYAAICFVFLQVAEIVVPALPIPEWIYTAIVVAAIAGFPVAVVLGWIYDLTDRGIRRSPPAARRSKRSSGTGGAHQ